MEVQLVHAGIKANLIWSIDEQAGIGLLDVLPASANKLHAIRFLMQQKGYAHDNTVFAGDSGNDLDVLMSDIRAVLVANADAEVKNLAARANKDALYLAHGGYLGMNGNYSAGILEGVAHYRPDVDAWLREQN
jgi:hydroxymethylpyrimidine pyrophosphatase-like HAD family hydrolase